VRWAVLAALATVLLASPAVAGNSALIWSDEFDGANLDPRKWTARRDCWGGGNEERQCYVNDAETVTVSDGMLRITARRQAVIGRAKPEGDPSPERVSRDFTSGRIETRGLASFRFGRIAVRAKLPIGQGLWPAIWMLPEHDNYGPYPLSGEIDLAEAVNLGVRCMGCLDRVQGAVHHGPDPARNRMRSGAVALRNVAAFHVYALDWTPTKMTWSVDGRPYFSEPTRQPFDQRFHLILNLAVGGRWPETTGRGGLDEEVLPATLMIDWVRVFAEP
jgi:beta-glucanase (GH16 family)